MHALLQRGANQATAMGPAILVQNLQLQRPTDVVGVASLSVDDRRAILAAWASDLYAVDSHPALRHLPGTPEPVSIDAVQTALRELDRRYG